MPNDIILVQIGQFTVPQKREKPVTKRKRKSKDGNTPGEDDTKDEDEFHTAAGIAQTTRKLAKMLNKRKW